MNQVSNFSAEVLKIDVKSPWYGPPKNLFGGFGGPWSPLETQRMQVHAQICIHAHRYTHILQPCENRTLFVHIRGVYAYTHTPLLTCRNTRVLNPCQYSECRECVYVYTHTGSLWLRWVRNFPPIAPNSHFRRPPISAEQANLML